MTESEGNVGLLLPSNVTNEMKKRSITFKMHYPERKSIAHKDQEKLGERLTSF